MALFWLTFFDPDAVRDTEFLGVAVMQADTFNKAIGRTWELGINPGGEVQGEAIPDDGVPPDFKDKLLSLYEAKLIRDGGPADRAVIH
ncbi:hypothetical protein DIE20_11370 [Burkholderia sp. Bp9131]|uniref:hypothetical protein n=1 Tax=Burkholderia sp. Bp9131 TaxID=2184571 RepID=UPI000F5643F2|nr:hypothetical protein [Burkholderia sp. Bp9131]RQR43470.1 hypothetical protein DIE20_11370 [Burkholderia sp. Bp9131]